jgi:hypothetical protein
VEKLTHHEKKIVATLLARGAKFKPVFKPEVECIARKLECEELFNEALGTQNQLAFDAPKEMTQVVQESTLKRKARDTI